MFVLNVHFTEGAHFGDNMRIRPKFPKVHFCTFPRKLGAGARVADAICVLEIRDPNRTWLRG